MSQFTIAVVDYDYLDIGIEKEIVEGSAGELVYGHAQTEDEVIEIARNADGIINQYASITRKILAALPKCKVVSRYGIGVDTIDAEAATDLGVVVCNVPAYCIHEVSDHALALMLSLSRRIVKANNQIKKGGWDFSLLTPIFPAQKCTVGIVGLGNIGKCFAQKVKALGYTCIATDPYIDAQIFIELGVKQVSLPELLKSSDVVSLHVPLTEETHHLIGVQELEMMKPTAILINTARGKIVDQEALAHALKSSTIAGAGLDVLEAEPPAPRDPVVGLENAIITPHIAYYSEESIVRLRSITTRSAIAVLQGVMPYAVVNPEVLKRIKLKESDSTVTS